MKQPFDSTWKKAELIKLSHCTFQTEKDRKGEWIPVYYRFVRMGNQRWIEVTGPNNYSEPWMHFIVPQSKVEYIEVEAPQVEVDYWNGD